MNSKTTLKLDTTRLRPGLRLAVGVSGGADSVALLRALHGRAGELGLVLSVAHLHHGLRGAEADGDLEFVRELAGRLGLPFLEKRVETAAEATRLGQTIEEAARRLRYGWFRELMGEGKATAGPSTPPLRGSAQEHNGFSDSAGEGGRAPHDIGFPRVDAVATAHTLDDQAETVLAKLLRGAWTEGIAGVHPVVEFAEAGDQDGGSSGKIVRPLLGVRRLEVEAYLKALGQPWREDSSNRSLTFTRNRIRHELLPLLEGWNPKLKEHLAQMANLARDEQRWWDAEVARVVPQVVLSGRPVRGGGRAAAEGAALDVGKLAELHPALQRRLVRHAAGRLGVAIDFAGTEALRELALTGRAGQKCELEAGLRAERSHRELRLSIQAVMAAEAKGPAEVEIPVPGQVEAVEFGLRVRIEVPSRQPPALSPQLAFLRCWRAGDRVQLRQSSRPRKMKEVLERMKISGTERARWPVLELNGRIVWMQGLAIEPATGIVISVAPIGAGDSPLGN